MEQTMRDGLNRVARSLERDPAIQEALRFIHESNMRIMEKRAKKDPEGNKLCRVMAEGKSASYRYWNAKQPAADGSRVVFGYTCWKNVAGYFLTFREIRTSNEWKRDQWVAHKQRKIASGFAKRCADDFDGRI